MTRTHIGILLLLLVIGTSGIEATAGRGIAFNSASVRGRYTGHVTIAEKIANGDGGAPLDIQGNALMALTFTGDGSAAGVVSVTALVSGGVFTCVFDATGVYQVAEDGLGTAALDIVPKTACAGPTTLKMSLLVGGKNRNRLDVTLDGIAGEDAAAIAMIGAGVLVEQ